jgi:hypothetical protein
MIKKMTDIQKNESKTVPNADPCVRCGYCCKQRPCSYGKDDGTGKCCFFKVADEHLMIYSCSKRDEIMKLEKDSNVPMFDNYCSSAFMNTTRGEVLSKLGKTND